MLTARKVLAAIVCMAAIGGAGRVQSALAHPTPPGGSGGVAVTPSPGQGGVGIGATDPGGNSSGTTTESTSGNGGSGNSTDPCVYEPASPPPGPDTPIGVEIATYGGTAIYEICPGGSGGLVWIPKGKRPPPAAIDLARTSYGELPLLDPAPGRYPIGELSDRRPYTIVQTHMWFSTSPTSWATVSKKVCAGTLCATAVAKPTTLTFDPGNGADAVSCPGPGSTFHRPAGGSWVPGQQPEGCDYQYTKSSYGMPNGEVTSTYTIGWTVTWTATNGQSGTFNDLQTKATSRFAVAELQSVVTR